jgi:glucose-1-phosphate thymidylyltransferase
MVSDSKREIIRLLGDGGEQGVKLAYVPREVPRGLADAIIAALDWVGDEYVALALPDTIFEPVDAFRILIERLIQINYHLVLGVFPTSTPQDLGPVDVDCNGRVLKVWDKPREPTPKNTWGIAVWTSFFSRFLKVFFDEYHISNDLSVGCAFQAAVEKGLKVSAVEFVAGAYADLGTPMGITSLLREVGKLPACRVTFS